MDVLNPPRSYIDYRCYTYGLNGQELQSSQDKFYKKNSEYRGEISKFMNWLNEVRQNRRLPHEKIEIRETDGKKRGKVVSLMIMDIEYWIEGGTIKQRKIYTGDQGCLNGVSEKKIREPGEEDDGPLPF